MNIGIKKRQHSNFMKVSSLNIQTAFFAYSAKLTASTARTLKKYFDAKQYEILFLEIKETFGNKLVIWNTILCATAVQVLLFFNLFA